MEEDQQHTLQEGISIELTDAPLGTEARFHTLNQGDEIQRENITDDTTAGLLIQADLLKVLHGQESPDGEAATLIVIGFRFQGINQRRRFREVQVTIYFEDEEEPLLHAPEVVAIWPDREYSYEETSATVEDTHSVEQGASAGASVASATLTGRWEVKTTTNRANWAVVTGARVRRGREYGKRNAVALSLYENASQRSGVVRELRAAILLRLHEDTDRFRGYFSINALADVHYRAAWIVHQLVGDRRNDPVIFKRGVQFPEPKGALMADQQIDLSNLRSVNLRQLGDAVSVTRIDAVRDDDLAQSTSELPEIQQPQ
ncbi:hypothetical protein F4820DRAFT_422140 [Hypoxylon rubiginosum]|uniref:Uncharacterized protein n=1 Tax=Hypoxylon rubiginosum TaxID=110542 RepID=A0ACB9Z0D9_9PEZI|nr:hypothetical protein F4820DRAFT_422140 [Hypoxylon rubiginosum]